MSDFAENLHTEYFDGALNSFLMLFWPPKFVVTPWGYFNPPKMLRNALWFLDVVGFCLNFALNFFEFWLLPGNQSYWVLFKFILGLYMKNLVKIVRIILFRLFLPFLVKNTLHVVTKWCFRRFLAYFFQYIDVVWSSFVIWTLFTVC